MLRRLLFGQARRKSEDAEAHYSSEISSLLRERTYLADTPYVLPKDAQEEERMAFQHRLLTSVFGLYNVPLPDDPIILDVGSGAGMWSRAVAYKLPKSQVFAVDLEEPKVTGHLVPENYHYTKANLLKFLPFQINSFHMVYQRLLTGAIPTTLWSHLFEEELRVLQYGGWLEAIEVADICINTGPLMENFMQWLRGVCQKNGIYLAAVKNIPDTLKIVGFKNVTSQEVSIPLGEWGGPNGKNFELDMIHIFKAFKTPIVMYCHIPPEKFDEWLDMLPAEWKKYQTSYVWYHIKAQKVIM